MEKILEFFFQRHTIFNNFEIVIHTFSQTIHKFQIAVLIHDWNQNNRQRVNFKNINGNVDEAYDKPGSVAIESKCCWFFCCSGNTDLVLLDFLTLFNVLSALLHDLSGSSKDVF